MTDELNTSKLFLGLLSAKGTSCRVSGKKKSLKALAGTAAELAKSISTGTNESSVVYTHLEVAVAFSLIIFAIDFLTGSLLSSRSPWRITVHMSTSD